MRAARRLQRVPAYPFVRWNERCREAEARGVDVIRLDVGDPDLTPPDAARESLHDAVDAAESHRYPGDRIGRELREAIASYYARRFGVDLDPESQVVPLIGSKEGIVHLALACVDPGDVVLVPDPGYAPYTIGTILAGGDPVPFTLSSDRGFLPDLEAIPPEVVRRAVLLWLNYPNNPTGAVADFSFLAAAVGFARRHRILLCHDAPYVDVAFDGHRPTSILEVPGAADVALEFHSLSKTFNTPGWRVGMAVGNPDAVALLSRVKSNVDSGIFSPLQAAAARALAVDEAWIVARNAVYRERLGALLEGAETLGLSAAVPRATPYLWARIPSDWASERFAARLLDVTGVAVAPGSFFGVGGEGYVRISATAPTGRIREAVERFQRTSGQKMGDVDGIGDEG